MEEYYQEPDECEYIERSYYESDTGYAEYECTLLGCECRGYDDRCPLSFKYQVIEE